MTRLWLLLSKAMSLGGDVRIWLEVEPLDVYGLEMV